MPTTRTLADAKIGTAWHHWRGQVVGVDAGTVKCGLAVVDHRGLLLASGQYPLRGATFGHRVLGLAEIVQAWLATEPIPAYLAVEKPVFMPRIRSGGAAYVGQGFGVTCMTAARAGIPVLEISPTAAKSALTGRGTAQKDTMQAEAIRQFHLQAVGEDEADAIGIALAGLREVRRFLLAQEAGADVGAAPAAHKEAGARRARRVRV